jgi:RNA polymerase sigma-70 factor (ECF subfamily)
MHSDFDQKTWQAFRRMAVDGHLSAEIAADLGMTKDAVRQAKCRVLRRLRDELDGML